MAVRSTEENVMKFHIFSLCAYIGPAQGVMDFTIYVKRFIDIIIMHSDFLRLNTCSLYSNIGLLKGLNS